MIRRWGIFDIYGWLSVCNLYNFIYRFHERRLRFCCWVGGTSSMKEVAAPGQDRTLTCFKISFNMLLQCQTPPASSDVSLTPTPSRELLHLRTDADVRLSLESTLLKSGGKLWTLPCLSQVICRLPAGRTICLDIPQSKDSLTLPSLQRGRVLTQARAGAVRTKWPHVSVSISPSQQELRTGRTDPVEPWILDWVSQWRELPAEPCEPRPGWRCRWRRGRPARRTGTARSRGCNGQALARCQVGRSGWSRSPLEHILSCSGARCQQDGGWGSAFPWTPSWHYREHWQCEWSRASAVLQGWSSPWRCRWRDQEEPHPFPSRPHYTTQSWVPREKALTLLAVFIPISTLTDQLFCYWLLPSSFLFVQNIFALPFCRKGSSWLTPPPPLSLTCFLIIPRHWSRPPTNVRSKIHLCQGQMLYRC